MIHFIWQIRFNHLRIWICEWTNIVFFRVNSFLFFFLSIWKCKYHFTIEGKLDNFFICTSIQWKSGSPKLFQIIDFYREFRKCVKLIKHICICICGWYETVLRCFLFFSCVVCHFVSIWGSRAMNIVSFHPNQNFLIQPTFVSQRKGLPMKVQYE